MVWVNYNYIAIIMVVIVIIRCKDEPVANPSILTIIYNMNDKHTIIIIGSRIIGVSAVLPFTVYR